MVLFSLFSITVNVFLQEIKPWFKPIKPRLSFCLENNGYIVILPKYWMEQVSLSISTQY